MKKTHKMPDCKMMKDSDMKGMKGKKGYMKGGMAKGGKVRGAGCAQKGARKAKMV